MLKMQQWSTNSESTNHNLILNTINQWDLRQTRLMYPGYQPGYWKERSVTFQFERWSIWAYPNRKQERERVEWSEQ